MCASSGDFENVLQRVSPASENWDRIVMLLGAVHQHLQNYLETRNQKGDNTTAKNSSNEKKSSEEKNMGTYQNFKCLFFSCLYFAMSSRFL